MCNGKTFNLKNTNFCALENLPILKLVTNFKI